MGSLKAERNSINTVEATDHQTKVCPLIPLIPSYSSYNSGWRVCLSHSLLIALACVC